MATTVGVAPTLDESAVQGLAAAMRGNLVRPDDPGYDEARTIYNAMIDKRPALIAQCETVADVIAAVNFARDNNVARGHPRRRAQRRRGWATCDDGLVIDLSPMNGVRVDPAARTARVEGGALLGRTAPRHECVRAGNSQRHHLHHRRRRHHPRRRHRSSHPPVRPGYRQSARGRRRARRRQLRHGEREGAPRSLLGVARRRRQLRRRHLVPLPAPPDPQPLRRTDALAAGPLGRGAALVPRVHHQCPGRSQWVLRLPDAFRPWRPSRRSCGTRRCAAWSGPTPGHAEEVFAPIRAQFGAAGPRLGGTDYPPGAQQHVRWALSGRRPVVLEGRLRQGDSRRSGRSSMSSMPSSCRPGSRRCTSTRSTASRAGWPRTPPPGTTGTPSGAWSWSGSARTRPTTST